MKRTITRPDIGIVGYGFVGRSLHKLFGSDAIELDVDATEADRQAINRCRCTFVCVPTPVGADGVCDTSIVADCVDWIESDIIVIRSTISPGTTEDLRRRTGKRIIFQPEYVGETPSHPLADVRQRDFIILGGPREDTSPVADIYQRYYHSDIRFYFTDALTAELAKYMENSFYAMKVMFCNEFYSIAEALGVDYNELREIWLADPRINRDHTFVYPDNRGFSGKCLPKDVSAIIQSSREAGFTPPLLQAIMAVNGEYRADDPTYEPNRLRGARAGS
jgi:UDPglucose 6-dehydrogenase